MGPIPPLDFVDCSRHQLTRVQHKVLDEMIGIGMPHLSVAAPS